MHLALSFLKVWLFCFIVYLVAFAILYKYARLEIAWEKALIATAISALVSVLLILTHELGHYFVATYWGLNVAWLSINTLKTTPLIWTTAPEVQLSVAGAGSLVGTFWVFVLWPLLDKFEDKLARTLFYLLWGSQMFMNAGAVFISGTPDAVNFCQGIARLTQTSVYLWAVILPICETLLALALFLRLQGLFNYLKRS